MVEVSSSGIGGSYVVFKKDVSWDQIIEIAGLVSESDQFEIYQSHIRIRGTDKLIGFINNHPEFCYSEEDLPTKKGEICNPNSPYKAAYEGLEKIFRAAC